MNTQVKTSEGHVAFVDLDDTLIHTSRMATKAELDVAGMNYDAAPLREARLTTASFDPITFMQEHPELYLRWFDKPQTREESDRMIEEWFLKIFNNITEHDRECLKRSGADDLLGVVAVHAVHFEILTYGNPAWQKSAKLQAAGLAGKAPCRTTDRRDKSEWVAEMKQDGGGFLLPTEEAGIISARSVVIMDDNPRNFQSLPEGAYGIHLINDYGGRSEEMFGWEIEGRLMWAFGRQGAILAYEELIRQGLIVSSQSL